ncbi:MAG: DegT/DnrJ/EryC1/StrS family aminotransferase [Myxococcales bacterium]|nr:DegT/DnrJ/EryC1/StrS family aminotransferase [Myxococcales bacterium]
MSDLPIVPFGDLDRQYRNHREAIDGAVRRALGSGWYILGKELAQFERDFAVFCEAPHIVGCANGTDAIVLALMALDVAAGDEVVVPALTAMPTATAVRQVGATPVFADIDPLTGLVTAETVAAVLSAKTRAVIAVHLYGQCCELAPLKALCDLRGVHLIEDAAQAHGARDAGRPVGWAGAATTFSFYPTKNLGALGDAGAVLTHREPLAQRLRRLRDYGQASKYEHVEHGINSRLDELQAAVLGAKLPALGAANARRRAIAARYDAALDGHPRARPSLNRQGEGHARHLYPVLTEAPEALRAALSAAKIGHASHYPKALPEQPAIAAPRGAWAAAAHFARHHVTLPMYAELRDDEVARVCAVLAAR